MPQPLGLRSEEPNPLPGAGPGEPPHSGALRGFGRLRLLRGSRGGSGRALPRGLRSAEAVSAPLPPAPGRPMSGFRRCRRGRIKGGAAGEAQSAALPPPGLPMQPAMMMFSSKYWARRGFSLDSALPEERPAGLTLNRSTSGKNEEKKGNKGNGKGESASESGKTAVVFSLKNEVGGLVKALRLFQEKHVSMVHIESRKSKRRNSEVEIFVDCDCSKKEFNELIQLLKFQTNIVSLNPPENIWTDEEDLDCVPWFPRKISELDKCSQRVLMYGSELDADHPVSVTKIVL